jgi:hypothetical protein
VAADADVIVPNLQWVRRSAGPTARTTARQVVDGYPVLVAP